MSDKSRPSTSGETLRLEKFAAGTQHDFLALILKHVDAHVFMKDATGHYLYANPKACAALQRPLEEILGHTDAELMPEKAAAHLMSFDRQVFSAGRPLRREETLIIPDGTARTFLCEKIPVRQPDGTAMLIGFATDITELKAVEAALRVSQKDLHHTLESLPFSVVVVETPTPGQWTDLRARCMFFNHHWLDTLGYGTSDAATAEELTRHLYPDPSYRRAVWNRRTEAARHAAGNGGTAPAFEVRVTAKDGTVRQMLSGTSVLGNRMIVSLQDITELRQKQEALRISEERHRFLAENAHDVIWTMEPEGSISYVSPSIEAVRGFTPAEAMAQRLEEIHPPESLALAVQWWSEVNADLAAGRTPPNFRGEMAYYRKDGSIFWTEVMAYPLLHPDGSLTEVVGVTRDMTEQKRAKEAIEQAAASVRRSEEHYRLLSSNLYDTVLHMGDDSIVTWVSPSLQRVLGYTPEEWIGHPVTDFIVPEDAARAHANIERCITQHEPVIARYTTHNKEGLVHHAESYATPYIKTDGTRDGIVVSFHLIDTQVAMEKELERRARTDELTSLLNRREIFERLQDLTGPHIRTGDQVAVLFCDLDKFKDVNDLHGHRVGGDELMVILHGLRDQADALAVAEKLRAAVAEPIPTSAGPLQVTMSIGVALARADESTEELISRADTAMYRAKQIGRNQVLPIGGASAL